ncbi:AI-2E family transporter [Halopelagius longus]|uniref:AI-2E family transporter n=1 Tax=Halopelagius longus TaxID=1236180 RepID=A0A1H0ZAQ1_9EURY|nr:AI-2E family transporter [Halopelagius longus]RDI72911.1 AI-2E family transporter [Halopelagius longus]SDQ24462.1 Predicted PurR-regulated permease PerM [Halopelagius longus]
MTLLEMERSRLAWWSFGTLLAAALLYVFYSFVGTVVFGVFIYYATRPIYRRLRRRVRPPSLAAAVALFALALPVLSLVAYALAIAAGEALKLTDSGVFDLSNYPITADQFYRFADPSILLSLEPTDLSPEQLRSVFESLNSAAGTVAFLGVGAVHLFVMIAMAFYLLRDDHRLAKWTRVRFADDRGVFEAYAKAVDRDFHSIFFGNILNAVLTGTIGVIAYTGLNMVAPPGIAIPAAALVGLLAGAASLVPVVGMKLVYVPVAAYLGITTYLSDPGTLWFVVTFVAVSFVVVDTIPDLVLRPYVSGRSLHVGAVMIAYTLGPLLFGWYGIFLMPMALVLLVNFAKYVLPELLSGTPVEPYAVDPATIELDEPAKSDAEPAAAVGSDGAAAAGGEETEAVSDAGLGADAEADDGAHTPETAGNAERIGQTDDDGPTPS